MKRLLYLTFYFRPDLCAGSFRNSALFDELIQQAGDDVAVTVLTTMPNRYASFATQADPEEIIAQHRIVRLPLPKHKSGFRDQIRSFGSYAWQVQRTLGKEKFDAVFASSSRLFTAWLGGRIARKQSIPLYLDIRDIFSENITEILGRGPAVTILRRFLKRLEKKTFRSARHINLVSRGFMPYFQQYTQSSRSYFTNGIDDVFLQELGQSPAQRKPGPQRIVYAGNMGEGQGLHAIVPQAAERLGDDFAFRMFGDGGKRVALEEEVNKRGLRNVQVLGPIDRRQLIEEYRNADYLFLHLNNYKAFELVIPSKIFEYGATDKPILAGVAGYPAEFIEECLRNVFVFKPLDKQSLVEFLTGDSYVIVDRGDFREQFSRKFINQQMVDDIKRRLCLVAAGQ